MKRQKCENKKMNWWAKCPITSKFRAFGRIETKTVSAAIYVMLMVEN